MENTELFPHEAFMEEMNLEWSDLPQDLKLMASVFQDEEGKRLNPTIIKNDSFEIQKAKTSAKAVSFGLVEDIKVWLEKEEVENDSDPDAEAKEAQQLAEKLEAEQRAGEIKELKKLITLQKSHLLQKTDFKLVLGDEWVHENLPNSKSKSKDIYGYRITRKKPPFGTVNYSIEKI